MHAGRKRPRKEDAGSGTHEPPPASTIAESNIDRAVGSSSTAAGSASASAPPNRESGPSGPSSSSTSSLSCSLSYPFPPWTLSPWQSVVLSTKGQLVAHEDRAKASRSTNGSLLKDLTKFLTERRLAERKMKREQHRVSDRLGKQLFTAVGRKWDAAGRTHFHLLKQDFEAEKHSVDRARQADLLKETEELTRRLIDDMLADRRKLLSKSTAAGQNPRKRPHPLSDCEVRDAKSSATGEVPAESYGDGKRDKDERPVRERSSVAGEACNSANLTSWIVNPAAEDTVLPDPLSLPSHVEEEAPPGRSEGPLPSSSSCAPPLEDHLHLLNTLHGARPLRDYQRSALRWLLNLYERGLNGILADEMGLGKTVQTLALMAYFAEYKNDWGPHLVVVPTTVVLNWVAECRRWVPGLNVICYHGTAKERAKLRVGWTQEDAFHICVTTYNIIVVDRAVFRRRPWGILVLDEAHHIKNFASIKWRSLFDLQVDHRLMLTGTPLQSSVMELWSLFHFLLPFASAFRSDAEFREWFSDPMNEMVEGRAELNEDIVRRLQALLRPFLLRRLKKDVESQLPSKTERVVLCRLSRRQRNLYDEFMRRADTRDKLRQGGVGGMLAVLLALRKVCNHPDLFAERPTRSPFVVSIPFGQHRGAMLCYPRCVFLSLPLASSSSGAMCCASRATLNAAFAWTPCLRYCTGVRSVERCAASREPPLTISVQVDDVSLEDNSSGNRRMQPRHVAFPSTPPSSSSSSSASAALEQWLRERLWRDWVAMGVGDAVGAGPVASLVASRMKVWDLLSTLSAVGERQQGNHDNHVVGGSPSLGDGSTGKWKEMTNSEVVGFWANEYLRLAADIRRQRTSIVQRHQAKQRLMWECRQGFGVDAIAASPVLRCVDLPATVLERNFPRWCPSLSVRWRHWTTKQLLTRVCVYVPAAVSRGGLRLRTLLPLSAERRESFAEPLDWHAGLGSHLSAHVGEALNPHFPRRVLKRSCDEAGATGLFGVEGWAAHTRRSLSFPEKRLLIYDCGKFQVLEPLLKSLRSERHRALIFTQFTHMLDLLEKFLAFIGVTYLRIDGSTKAEQRQQFADLFNQREAITCMLLSTRSGGIGLNLTGADTVVFYDSDWNPTVDLQAQDRCHRIGQIRPVTIYRLISEFTVEEKILEKARERKMLNNVVIRGGQFHSIADITEGQYVSSADAYAAVVSSASSLRSFFHDLDEDASLPVSGSDIEIVSDTQVRDFRKAMTAAEDAEDRQALTNIERELCEIERENAEDEQLMGDLDAEVDCGGVGADYDVAQRASADRKVAESGGEASPAAVVRTIGTTLLHYNERTRSAKMDILRKAGGPPCQRFMALTFGATHPRTAAQQYQTMVGHYGKRLDKELAYYCPSSM